MPTIITLLAIVLLIKVIKQGIIINGYMDEENSREIEENAKLKKRIVIQHALVENTFVKDCSCSWCEKARAEQHPFINGDPCRCPECTDRYHKELTSNNK